ncbi:cytosine deaminase [Halalkalibacter hemicellulosilyticus]|uniref:Cytosine deaminase n=1 Tax=Halalkalibacter hemicellulosilyticusJCM 9152 TaxID=1236971 RepID=W4QD27_9BACI|nr:cytosine deaminase [Halalkalibacter hemicellulosilyticus]GAE29930.1 cytosine deaminase [Halalkalibacter hemicellulosilyticusJCM 9152]
MLFSGAILPDREGLWHILVRNGKIEQIAQRIDTDEDEKIDLNGKLVLPPYVEPHIHLDTTLTAGEPDWNQSGTLFEGIELWSRRKSRLTKEDVKFRARKVLKWQVVHGIQYVRTHVDVTDPKFIALEALLELKEEMSHIIDLQLVAFPQEGILSYPNGYELLEEAIKMGVDVVGGIPHFEFTREDGVESVKKAFKLAMQYDRLLDFHCDEVDDDHSRFIEVVAAEALRHGIGERVTASHTTAMHSYNDSYVSKLIRLSKKANIHFVANPLVNIHLQGRFDTYPKRRGITRVKELLDADINVCFGHDNVFDPWYPLGTGSMIQVLHLGLHACHLMGYNEINQAINLITNNSAKTLQISEYGVKIGGRANFNIVAADSVYDLIRRQAPIQYAIREGQVILETSPSQSHIRIGDEIEEVTFMK